MDTIVGYDEAKIEFHKINRYILNKGVFGLADYALAKVDVYGVGNPTWYILRKPVGPMKHWTLHKTIPLSITDIREIENIYFLTLLTANDAKVEEYEPVTYCGSSQSTLEVICNLIYSVSRKYT